MKETSPGTFEVVQAVKMLIGARALAINTATHNVYLPTAEFDPATAGQRRPTAKPDTFMVVVVGSK